MGKVNLTAVTRRYQAGDSFVTVLDSVDLDVPEGAFCVLSGPSGSGKSTLLNLIGGIDRPNSGTIVVNGTELAQLDEKRLAQFRSRTLGFVFQSFHLLPVLTAAENVAWPLYFQGIPARKRMKIARDMLALVGLAGEANRTPGRLSGGQRQRVAIARALVGHPKLVLADEPTANLDRHTAEEIIDLLQHLNREKDVTLIIATHDPLVIARAGMRVDFVGDGHIEVGIMEGGYV